MARELLTTGVNFYCNTQTGSLNNDGLSPGTALPQPQDVFDRIYQQYDLGGHQHNVWLATGQTFDGVCLNGPFVGDKGPSMILWGCMPGGNLGDAKIVPTIKSHQGLGMAFGATLQISNLTIEKSGEDGNDCVAVGQGSRLVIFGNNRLVQQSVNMGNWFSIYTNSSVDIFQGPSGYSTLYMKGVAQVGVMVDAASFFLIQANFNHGLIGITYEPPDGGGQTYCGQSYFDVAAGSKIHLAGCDFQNYKGAPQWAVGYTYRVRGGGTLELGLSLDPNQINVLPGSQPTAWPMKGEIL